MDPEKKHRCSICGMGFRYPYKLLHHERIHSGETPYRCGLKHCTRSFKWVSSLKSHMKSHERTAKLNREALLFSRLGKTAGFLGIDGEECEDLSAVDEEDSVMWTVLHVDAALQENGCAELGSGDAERRMGLEEVFVQIPPKVLIRPRSILQLDDEDVLPRTQATPLNAESLLQPLSFLDSIMAYNGRLSDLNDNFTAC